MGVWEAIELLNTLVDDSDPDVRYLSYSPFDTQTIVLTRSRPSRFCLQTSVSQIEHLLQTAEAIRRDGKPEWMQVRHTSIMSTFFILPLCSKLNLRW